MSHEVMASRGSPKVKISIEALRLPLGQHSSSCDSRNYLSSFDPLHEAQSGCDRVGDVIVDALCSCYERFSHALETR